MKGVLRKIIGVIGIVVLVFSLLPAVSVAAEGEYTFEYPKLDDKEYDYYKTSYPSGLAYSQGWYGTFTYAPPATEILLFDDTWSDEFGICIFAMPKGKAPSGEQGGTSLTKLTALQAETELKRYDQKQAWEPIEPEIMEVFRYDHHYIGAWAGDRLKQKFQFSDVQVTQDESGKWLKAVEVEVPVELVDEKGEIKTVTEIITHWIEVSTEQSRYLEETKNLSLKEVDISKYDPDRYFVMGQIYVEDVDSGINISGRKVTDCAFECTGAGTFKIYMASGTSGEVSGTGVDGTPVTLVAGENIITTTGAVSDGNIDITIGTAANWNTVNSWSSSSGGKCGASVSSSSDSTLFNLNSFTAASQVLTVNANANCLGMNWTGVTNNPRMTLSQLLNIYGDVTFNTGFTMTVNYVPRFVGTTTYVSGGNILSELDLRGNSFTLGDNCTFGRITRTSGKFITNGYNMTLYWSFGAPVLNLGGNGDITLGDSLITILSSSSGGVTISGSPPFTANTAVIDVQKGNVSIANGLNLNGATLNLTGSAHTVNGSFTCGNLTYDRTSAGAQTITQQAGSHVKVTGTFTATGDSMSDKCTIQSSVAGSMYQITAADIALTNTTMTNYVLAKLGGDVEVDCSGTTGGTFAGQDLTWGSLNITGSGNYSLRFTGNNTFSNGIDIDASVSSKTVNMTGTTQIVADMTRDTGANNISIVGGTINTTSSVPVNLHHLTVTDSTCVQLGKFYAVESTDGGGNSNWIFDGSALTVTTLPATEVSMDKDGVTVCLTNGDVADLAGSPYMTSWTEYGLTNAYGSNTTTVLRTSYVPVNAYLPDNLTPGQTYHYRQVYQNGTSLYFGEDKTVTFTMPTISTGGSINQPPTVRLEGEVSDMGVATDLYWFFEYGDTPAYGSFTPVKTLSGIGDVFSLVPSPSSSNKLYYRLGSTIGTVTIYGTGSSLAIPSGIGGMILKTLLRIILAAVIILGVIKFSGGNVMSMFISVTIGIIAFVIVDLMLISLI